MHAEILQRTSARHKSLANETSGLACLFPGRAPLVVLVSARGLKDRSGICGLGHLLRLWIQTVLDLRAIATQFFQQLDNLGDLVLAQYRKF
jgi:hypothetical protein